MSPGDVFALPVRHPYDWDALTGFLERRAVDGVELVTPQAYARVLRLPAVGDARVGWVRVRPGLAHSCLWVELSPSLSEKSHDALALLGFLFDAACDPAEVAGVLGPLASRHPGLRVPGAADGFELAVRAILGQQITVRAARTLAGRFAAAFGVPVDGPDLRCAFPLAADVAQLNVDDIARCGIIATRADAIRTIAQALASGTLDLQPGSAPAPCIAALKAIRGVGEWTAQYVAMRALGWRDAFPHGDLALRKALGGVTPRQALDMAEAWRPWRAYAAMHLWRSLS